MRLRTLRSGQFRMFQLVSLVMLISGFLIAIDQFPRGRAADAAGTATIRIEPADQTVDEGEVFNFTVIVNSDLPTVGTEIDFHFNPLLLQINTVTLGSSWPANANLVAGIQQTMSQAIASANNTGNLLNLTAYFLSGTGIPAGDVNTFNFIMQAKPGVSGVSALTMNGQDVVAQVDGLQVPVTTTSTIPGAVMIGNPVTSTSTSTASSTATETPTPMPSNTATEVGTSTPTSTGTLTNTPTFTATSTSTPTFTATQTPTPTLTLTATATPSPSFTPTFTHTPSPTATHTAISSETPGSETATSIATSTPTATSTVGAGGPTFSIAPATQTVEALHTFTVTISQNTSQVTTGAKIDLDFDSTQVTVESVAKGAAYGAAATLGLSDPSLSMADAIAEANEIGKLINLRATYDVGAGTVPAGAQHAFTVTFKAGGMPADDVELELSSFGLFVRDEAGQPVTATAVAPALVDIFAEPTPTATLPAGAPTLKVDPATQSVDPNEAFTVNIVQNASIVTKGWEVDVTFNKDLVQLTNIVRGSQYVQDGVSSSLAHGKADTGGPLDLAEALAQANGSGLLKDLAVYWGALSTQKVPTGTHTGVVLSFSAKPGVSGTSPITLVDGLFLNEQSEDVATGVTGGDVVIVAGADATTTPTPTNTATATSTPTGTATATASATAAAVAATTPISSVAGNTASPASQATTLPNAGAKSDVNRFLLALAVVLAAAGSSGITASALIRREMK